MKTALGALFRREFAIAARIGGASSANLVFFVSLVVLLPFAIGPDLGLLSRIGPALLWIAALLATMLGMDRLLQSDFEDGSLDLMTMAATPLEVILAAKCAAHWTVTVLPLIIATPVLALMLGLGAENILRLIVSLILGTPAITLLGVVGAALTVTVRRGGLLMSVVVLPFMIPVLIFGVSAADAGGSAPTPSAAPFVVLAGLSVLAFAGAPFAAAAAIRLTRE